MIFEKVGDETQQQKMGWFHGVERLWVV